MIMSVVARKFDLNPAIAQAAEDLPASMQEKIAHCSR